MATILEAATRVFEHEGLGATTNRIAEVAGVSIGSLYQYFPDKLSLVTALHHQHQQAVAQRLADDMAATGGWPLAAAVRQLVGGHLALHRQQPRLQRLLHADLPQLAECGGDSAAKQALSGRLQAWLQQRLPALALAPATAALAAQTVMTLAESLVHQAVLNPPAELDDGALADNIAQAIHGYLQGLGSPG